MQKLHQKQLHKLKEQQKVKQLLYTDILTHMVSSHQQLKEVLLFAKDTFHSLLSKLPDNSSPPPFFLSDFTPSSISKLVFQPHLHQIKLEFDKLPDSQAKLEHFLLIMIKVIFIDPTRLIQKQKQQEIIKNLFIKQNQKKNHPKPLNSNKKLSSPKKIKSPPDLTKTQNSQTKKVSPSLQQKPQHASSQIDKYPFYMIALLYMFKQIVLGSSTTISFGQLQKFIMGEVVTSSKPISNTEFTIQFEETKKQDFLLHDNGIRRLTYCAGLGVYLCLDTGHQMVKIYTNELKNKQNFQVNRQKHNRKAPEIVDMFYSDFGSSLGLVLGDKTIEVVNFEAFMTRLYEKEFLALSMNEIVVGFEMVLKRIFFLQMFNKWLVVGAKNELVLVDVSKYRSREEQIIMTSVKNEKQQLNITQVLEIIPLSVVCIIAGNEIWFMDEKLSRKKYNTYVHEGNIAVVKYYEERNAFYLCGDREKSLVVLRPQRGRDYMEISTVTFSRPILDFELFSTFNAILLIDDKHTLRLVAEENKHLYQLQEYARIVKDEIKENAQGDQSYKRISILKLSRQQFIIHESYMVSMSLAKVPVQTQMQFEFIPYHYFDPVKEDIYLSFNNQILSISLLQAEIRDSFNLDNSNLQPPSFFFIDNSNWAPFVLDLQGKVYDLSPKDNESGADSDTKKYKRKLELKDLQSAVFDSELGRLIGVSPHQIYQVRNQTKNTFSTVNVTNFTNFQVLSSTYIHSKKSLLLNCLSSSNPILLSSSQSNLLNTSSSKLLKQGRKPSGHCEQPQPVPQQQFCLQVNVNQPSFYRVIKLRFQKIKQSDKPEVILRCLYIEDYDVAVVLTDQNVVYLVDVGEHGGNDYVKGKEDQQGKTQVYPKERKFICIKVYHFIAPKVRDLLKFNELYVNSLKIHTQSKNATTHSANHKHSPTSQYTSIFLTSEEGFFIEINLHHILQKHFSKPLLKSVEKHSTASLRELCEIDYLKFCEHQIQEIQLSKKIPFSFQKIQQEFTLVKAHNACKIQLMKKIYLEFLFTVSVGKDGFLKLWNQAKECIVSLKLPTLRKEIFDIRKIQDVRGRRMMEETHTIVQHIAQHIDQKQNLQQILQLTRQHELQKTYERINEDEPIKIEIENKSIEQIVVEEPSYQTLDALSVVKRFRHRYVEKEEKDSPKKQQAMSLKKQRSFEDILDKSRLNQVNESESMTIPSELLALRKPLKKYERKQQSKSIDLPGPTESNHKREQLLILPKLKEYKMQSRHGKHPATQRQSLTFRQHVDSQDSEYDTFEACAFVKNKISRKKGNQLDRIDKEFIRKEYSMLVKKHLARKKDAVKIVNGKGVSEEKEEMEDSGNAGVSLETIVNDIKRIRYESKFGGDRFIPKVKFKSFSQLD